MYENERHSYIPNSRTQKGTNNYTTDCARNIQELKNTIPDIYEAAKVLMRRGYWSRILNHNSLGLLAVHAIHFPDLNDRRCSLMKNVHTISERISKDK